MLKKISAIVTCVILAAAIVTACTAKNDTAISPAEGKAAVYKLSNPNATEKTVKTYEYLCGCFGSVMLSCQQEST